MITFFVKRGKLSGGVGQIFKNQPKDQVATKIPFEGRIDNPKPNIWLTISNTLQNAFIRAIQPSIDNEINIASVDAETKDKKTFLQKVFSKDDDKADKKDKKAERKEKRKARRAKKNDPA